MPVCFKKSKLWLLQNIGVLYNPNHPDFETISIIKTQEFLFDSGIKA